MSVKTVLNSTSPGAVYVDDIDSPQSYLIKTPECNFIGGRVDNQVFNSEIKKEISYYDSIVCNSDEWANIIKEIHPNCALKAYLRKYFKHTIKTEIFPPNDGAKIEFIYSSNINKLQYKNKELVLDWINILNLNEIPGVCLVAIVVANNKIVSCSAVDCVYDQSVEIGIKTIKEYQKRGYGSFAVSALVNQLEANGIKDIGWHCMATNSGSQKVAIKCGFRHNFDYQAFFPFPPIENSSDLSEEEWIELGNYFMNKGKITVDQYWQAARCFANTEREKEVFICIQSLIENNQTWFLDYIDECEEFNKLKNNETMKKILKLAEG